MFIQKKIPLQFVDFYQKFMNFRGVTKSYCITFGAAEPNSHQCKETCRHKKATSGNVHPEEKNNGYLTFSKWLSW